MASIFKLSVAGSVALLCLLSAGGRTVYDIPSLKADLGFKPPKTTEFDFTAKVILPCTTAEKDFFVTDGTNSIRLVNETHRNAFSVGDLVHVQGRIRPKGNPDCLSIEVVGKGQPEPIEELSVADFLRGRHDQRLVRVRGRVRSVQRDEIDPEWVFVTLSDGSAVTQADLRPSADDFRGLQKLVDAEVGVLGIAADGRFTRGMNRQLNPSTLVTRSLSNFQVLRPAPADPFSVPPIDESDVFPGRNEYQRRSAVGHVLVTYDGNHLILRTEQGASMNVELAESTPPAPGARIRVVGHPATDLYRFNLTDAIWRTEPGEPMPSSAAEEISLDDLLTDGHGRQMIKPSYHGRVIRIRGIVRILPGTGNAGSRMVLEGGSSTIPVDIGACPQVLADLVPGCEVAVTGICVMPTPNWHPNLPRPRIREVFVALQSPDGLKVLRRPPWWTPARLLALIAVLFAGLGAFVVWNRHLARRIERRSRELLDEQIAHVSSDLKTMERTRLAIELHDSLAQNLTGVALELQTVKDLVREDTEAAAAHLETADRSLKSCREELRNCLRDLRSEALETDDVNAAIRMTLDPHMADANVTIRFNVPRERLTDNTMHALLRIIRELALNAVRHGHATAIKVAGAIEDGKLLFSVSDNGCGFDVDKHPGLREGHFGLQGVHDRIRGFEGEMEIKSAVGHGTKVSLALTLPKEDNACRS